MRMGNPMLWFNPGILPSNTAAPLQDSTHARSKTLTVVDGLAGGGRWRQYSSACARTRWSCNPASVRFSSAGIRPTDPAKHSLVLLPPALTACDRTTLSFPINSTTTRHLIPLPRSAVTSLTHTTPRFETASEAIALWGAEPFDGAIRHHATPEGRAKGEER